MKWSQNLEQMAQFQFLSRGHNCKRPAKSIETEPALSKSPY